MHYFKIFKCIRIRYTFLLENFQHHPQRLEIDGSQPFLVMLDIDRKPLNDVRKFPHTEKRFVFSSHAAKEPKLPGSSHGICDQTSVTRPQSGLLPCLPCASTSAIAQCGAADEGVSGNIQGI